MEFAEGRLPKKSDFEVLKEMSFEGLADLIVIPEARRLEYRNRCYQLLENDASAPRFFPGMPELLFHFGSQNPAYIVTASNQASVD